MHRFIDHPGIGTEDLMTPGERVQHTIGNPAPRPDACASDVPIHVWNRARKTEFGSPMADEIISLEVTR